MMNLWTTQEISKILIQLDDIKLPFEKYSIVGEDSTLKLLGRGGSADVYEASKRGKRNGKYAIKVIGFKNQHADSQFFNDSIQAQEDIGGYQDNVVKIYDHTELWIALDEQDNVVSALKEKPEKMPKTCIKLQFVLMEKMSSVIQRTKAGNIKMSPHILAEGNQEEVLKLAYDIGSALQSAHNKKVLHRDVKLENVFYSEKSQKYKLGDFGIAKKTDDGFASTVAFTKGYAAPEVLYAPDNDRYDYTADIYSFGMMLYVLMNDMRFPDSNTYNVNYAVQYEKGYILPMPMFGSYEFYQIIAKMCMYDPDDRYQSMDEVILDIEKLMYGDSVGYQKEHKTGFLVVGTLALAIGVATWKLSMAPQLTLQFNLWEYIFWGLCFSKTILKCFKKSVDFASVIVLGVGIYLLVATGFSWGKLLIVLWMTLSDGVSSGYLSGGVLLVNFMYLFQSQNAEWMTSLREYSWITVLSMSFVIFLFFRYAVLTLQDRKAEKNYYKNDYYWMIVCAMYAALILLGWLINHYGTDSFIYKGVIYRLDMWFINNNVNLTKVGIYGLAFSIVWVVRERILIWDYRRKSKKYSEES